MQQAAKPRKGSGPIGLLAAPFLASWSALSLPLIGLWPWTHSKVTLFPSASWLSASLHPHTRIEEISGLPTALIAAWLSEQIVMHLPTFPSSLRILAHCRMANTSAWKTVENRPSGIASPLLNALLYSSAPVHSSPLEPSVYQMSPWRRGFPPSFFHASLSGMHVRKSLVKLKLVK